MCGTFTLFSVRHSLYVAVNLSMNMQDLTRKTLDCDWTNYSLRIVFS